MAERQWPIDEFCISTCNSIGGNLKCIDLVSEMLLFSLRDALGRGKENMKISFCTGSIWRLGRALACANHLAISHPHNISDSHSIYQVNIQFFTHSSWLTGSGSGTHSNEQATITDNTRMLQS